MDLPKEVHVGIKTILGHKMSNLEHLLNSLYKIC